MSARKRPAAGSVERLKAAPPASPPAQPTPPGASSRQPTRLAVAFEAVDPALEGLESASDTIVELQAVIGELCKGYKSWLEDAAKSADADTRRGAEWDKRFIAEKLTATRETSLEALESLMLVKVDIRKLRIAYEIHERQERHAG